jgi:uncharacterized coiled-coil protein SlyX
MLINEPVDELVWIAENRGDSISRQLADIVRQQKTEIDRLNYDLDGFKQNFFVSGFHLQIKMANEQLVKQQDEIEALKEQLEDCTCQGGHSQAYLKAKGKAQEKQ